MYYIVRCPKCGRLSIAGETKTRKCPYCGSVFLINPKNKKSRIVRAFSNWKEASDALQAIKAKPVENQLSEIDKNLDKFVSELGLMVFEFMDGLARLGSILDRYDGIYSELALSAMEIFRNELNSIMMQPEEPKEGWAWTGGVRK